MRRHRLFIKKNSEWVQLYQGSQLSHMERFEKGLKAKGLETKIESDPKVSKENSTDTR